MSSPYLGEIKLFAGNFAPRGYAFCDGQLLSISQNSALFAILGTTYGGNGQTTFALPDLRGRVPMHAGSGPGLTPRVLGESGGTETVTLLATQMPIHAHVVNASNGGGNSLVPTNALLATDAAGGSAPYITGATANVTMNPASIATAGGGQPHPNVQPFLAVSFIIALQGIFPSRN